MDFVRIGRRVFCGLLCDCCFGEDSGVLGARGSRGRVDYIFLLSGGYLGFG